MRYLPLTDADRQMMLGAIGVASIDELFCDVPREALLTEPVALPRHRSEVEVERLFRGYAARNVSPSSTPCFLGAGFYHHHIPAAVDHLIQRGEFLTAYTPYQPEIAQGTLQYLFEFQTQVALITGMDVANASLYDGATACAEAMMMACRLTKRKRVILSGGLHPHYRTVTETYARLLHITALALPPAWEPETQLEECLEADVACVIVQTPDIFGRLSDYRELAAACRAQGALLVVVVTEVLSLGAVLSPGEMGADIVAGEGQSLGNALSFGGPSVGLLATREAFVRQMPGRLVGETVDADGKRGYVLTLSTREQHIRREKATSNICTNSGLCALAFTIHLALLGERGFSELAQLNHATACRLADLLAAVPGVQVLNETFFNEFTLRISRPAEAVVEHMVNQGVLGGVPVSRLLPGWPQAESLLLVASTELTTEDDMCALTVALESALA